MMSEASEKRVALSINLTPKARAVLEALRDDTGVPNTTSTERILEWFSAMPRKFRVALLTKDDVGRDELLTEWFQEYMVARGIKVELLDGTDYDARMKQVLKLLRDMHIIYAGKAEAARELAERENKRKKG